MRWAQNSEGKENAKTNSKHHNMKTTLLKIYFLLLIVVVLGGCRTVSFSYTRDNILKNFSNYEVFLNNERISLETIYLDKDNIKSIKTNETEKTIHITQKNKNVGYFSAKDLLPLKEGSCSGEDFTLVIDGDTVILNSKLVENITLKTIEIGAIKKMSFLKKYPEIYGNCRNGTLVITLK